MTDNLLNGAHIAITRPVNQAHKLCAAIHHHGGYAVTFPLLATAPLADYGDFEQAISQLEQAHWATFISTNAVNNAMPRVLKKYGSVPANLKFAAIGQQTAKALELYGIHRVLTPHTRFDSESLLALAEMHHVAHQTVIIFRGVGGRDVLANTLASRGAHVILAESYCRINPQTSTQVLDRAWQQGELDAVVVTSSESMRNLLGMSSEREWLRHVTLCVNHARIAELPLQLGLKVLVADAPDDQAMIQCLSQLVNKVAN